MRLNIAAALAVFAIAPLVEALATSRSPETSLYVTEYYDDCPYSTATATGTVTSTSCFSCTKKTSGFGNTTIARITTLTTYSTVFLDICPTGTVFRTFTITESRSSLNQPHPTNYVPQGFVIATVDCHVCAETPIPVVLTTPVAASPGPGGAPGENPAKVTGAPGSPVAPWTPGTPGHIGNPGSPVTPSNPENSGAPGTPGTPSTPVNPVNPVNPGAPGPPVNPGAPGTPINSVNSSLVAPGGTVPVAASTGIAASGASSPAAAIPGPDSPAAATPSVASPGAATPGAGPPGAASPGPAIPGAGPPGAASPGSATPGVAIPSVATPGPAAPSTASSGATSPGASPTPGSNGVIPHSGGSSIGDLKNLPVVGVAPSIPPLFPTSQVLNGVQSTGDLTPSAINITPFPGAASTLSLGSSTLVGFMMMMGSLFWVLWL